MSDPRTDPVAAVDIARVAVPLERTIRLGDVSIDEREYAVLRIRTARGLHGLAIGYTRGLPLVDELGRRAATIVGRDATSPIDAMSGLATGPDDESVVVRALSLIEIALRDIEAKAAGEPLWRLLGGGERHVPVLAVGGYFDDQRSFADIADEFRALVASGFRHVKVHSHDPLFVERLHAVVGADALLSVDLHMRYSGLDDAVRECSVLDALGLGFIEDPFPPSRPDLTAALAAELETPVAAGEDAVGERALVAIARAADVLRVDSTASGGIAVARRAAAEATSRGCATMTHAFVELHAQVAAGTPEISAAETIPYATGANPVDRLLRDTQPIESGTLTLSEEPGNGLVVDWDAVCSYATHAITLTPDEGS